MDNLIVAASPTKLSRRRVTVEKAGFTYLQIALQKGTDKKKWICPRQKKETSVERAVLSYFELEGWKGYWKEGGLLLTLIKTMAFKILDVNVRTRYVEAMFNMAERPDYGCHYTVAELLETLKLASFSQVAHNFDYMNLSGSFADKNIDNSYFGLGSLQDQYPGLERWMVMELLKVAGHDLMFRIATIFATDPYKYRRGWPDLTIWKGNQLRFIEVKAPGDSLGNSQKVIASAFATPLELDFRLVDVVPFK